MTARQPSGRTARMTASEIVQLAVLAAIMIVCKEIMNVLPNIHLTTPLIILGAMVYGWKVLYPIAVFILVQGLRFGFGSWFIMYLYAWPICAAAAICFRHVRSRIFWACFAGLQGLTFGALCALTYIFLGGIHTAVAYWIAGIPYDLIHGLSNTVVTFFLLMPLYNLLKKVREHL